MEGGGLQIQLGGVFGGIISGNYFEANTQSPLVDCDIDLDVAGASTHRGLSIIGNQFQPTTSQKADSNYYSIRLGNVLSTAGREPTISGNVTSGSRLVAGEGTNTPYFSNFVSGANNLSSHKDAFDHSFTVSRYRTAFFNNRATAYDSGTSTWSIFEVQGLSGDVIIEFDGVLNLSNIGGNVVGKTLVSFKMYAEFDGAGDLRAGLIGTPVIEELAGDRNASGDSRYTAFWGASVAISFTVVGSSVVVKMDNFNDYSTPGLGVAYSVGAEFTVKSSLFDGYAFIDIDPL
jgi:hypothetical protein